MRGQLATLLGGGLADPGSNRLAEHHEKADEQQERSPGRVGHHNGGDEERSRHQKRLETSSHTVGDDAERHLERKEYRGGE